MFNIFGFYKFKKINNLKKLKKKLENNLKDYGISGTIIISSEGVNGTISAKNNNLLKFNWSKFNLKDLFLLVSMSR